EGKPCQQIHCAHPHSPLRRDVPVGTGRAAGAVPGPFLCTQRRWRGVQYGNPRGPGAWTFMAAASVTPRVRLMAVCDRVRESNLEAGVYHVKGLRQRTAAPAFPFAPSRLWLLLVFSSPRAGVFPGYVLVVHDPTDKSILYGPLTPPPAFEEERET